MTINLGQRFRTNSRNELIDVIKNYIKTIDSEHILKNKLPLIIKLNGTRNSGKSLVLDILNKQLLGGSATLDRENSKTNESDERTYESWVGDTTAGSKIKIFFTNIHALTDDSIQKCIFDDLENIEEDKIDSGQYTQLGNIIILSGVRNSYTGASLEITLTADHYDKTLHKPTDWCRETHIVETKPIPHI